jgi:hypothetical protein
LHIAWTASAFSPILKLMNPFPVVFTVVFLSGIAMKTPDVIMDS